MLYNTNTLKQAMQYIQDTMDQETPLDLAVSEYDTHCWLQSFILFRFRQTAGLQGFLVQPNLVQHIGMVSSLTKKKDPLEFVDQIYR